MIPFSKRNNGYNDVNIEGQLRSVIVDYIVDNNLAAYISPLGARTGIDSVAPDIGVSSVPGGNYDFGNTTYYNFDQNYEDHIHFMDNSIDNYIDYITNHIVNEIDFDLIEADSTRGLGNSTGAGTGGKDLFYVKVDGSTVFYNEAGELESLAPSPPSENIKKGIVVKTISRGEPIEYNSSGDIIKEAVPAVETYGIMEYGSVPVWAISTLYQKDDIVIYAGSYYIALSNHFSTEANSPLLSMATWEVYEGIEGVWQVEPNANPLLFVPFLETETVVTYSLVNGIAHIHGTPVKVQTSTTNTRYSLYWDQNLGRAKAVFA